MITHWSMWTQVRVICEILNICFKAVIVSFVIQYMEERRHVDTGKKATNDKEFALTLILIVAIVGLVNSVAIFLTDILGWQLPDVKHVTHNWFQHAIKHKWVDKEKLKGMLDERVSPPNPTPIKAGSM